MKKAISVILSLVLALSCLIAITPFSAMAEDAVVEDATTEAATTNILVNGSFEDDLTGWYIKGASDWYASRYKFAVSDEEHNTGAKSLSVNNEGTAYPNNSLCQTVVLKANTNYIISFYAKGCLGYSAIRVTTGTAPWNDDDNGLDVINRVATGWLTATSTDWTKYTYSFKTNSNTEYTFALTAHHATTNVHFDDFCLEEVPAHSDIPVPDTGLVVNGTFEDSFDGWTKTNYGGLTLNASISGEQGYSGYQSLYFYNGTGASLYNRALYQDITLEANSKYKLSFYSKGHLGWGRVRVTDTTNTEPWNGGTNDVFDKQLSDENAEWTKYTFLFDTDDRTSYRLALAFTGAAANVYLDDISITKYESNSIIQNPGFEDGMIGWETNASSMKVETTMADSNSGELSLHRWLTATIYNQSVYQNIKLEANMRYKLSFYIKGNPAYGKMRVVTSDGTIFSDEKAVLAKQLTSEYDEWTKVSYYFYTNEATDYILSWTMQSAGDAYFDDFEIVKFDKIIANGGFEDGMDEWVTTNSPEVEVDNYEKYSGNNSLYNYVTGTASKYNRTVSQQIKLAPYTEYTIKMWVKGNPGWGRFFIQDDVTLDTYNHDNSLLNVQLTDEYAEWTEISYTFITGEATDARLVFYFSSVATDINIDDIEIKATDKVVGDFDGTGAPAAEDVTTMKKFMIGADSGLEDTAILDITGDEKIDIVDFIRLKKIIASLA